MDKIMLAKGDYTTSKLMFRLKSGGKSIPLINGKLMFSFINKATNQKVGGGECQILDMKQGLVQYAFKHPELEQEGDYKGSAQADLSQGARRESVPLEFGVLSQEQIDKLSEDMKKK